MTFTCYPEWPEIKEELFPGQRSFDRHDIIARGFHSKMKKMLAKDKYHMLSVE